MLRGTCVARLRNNYNATREGMAVIQGSVRKFDPSEEDWDTYAERVEIHLAASKITDETEKRNVLLTVCGAKTYTFSVTWWLRNSQQ